MTAPDIHLVLNLGQEITSFVCYHWAATPARTFVDVFVTTTNMIWHGSYFYIYWIWIIKLQWWIESIVQSYFFPYWIFPRVCPRYVVWCGISCSQVICEVRLVFVCGNLSQNKVVPDCNLLLYFPNQFFWSIGTCLYITLYKLVSKEVWFMCVTNFTWWMMCLFVSHYRKDTVYINYRSSFDVLLTFIAKYSSLCGIWGVLHQLFGSLLCQLFSNHLSSLLQTLSGKMVFHLLSDFSEVEKLHVHLSCLNVSRLTL